MQTVVGKDRAVAIVQELRRLDRRRSNTGNCRCTAGILREAAERRHWDCIADNCRWPEIALAQRADSPPSRLGTNAERRYGGQPSREGWLAIRSSFGISRPTFARPDIGPSYGGHPSPAFMSEGWWTRRVRVGTELRCGCVESMVSGRSHNADLEASPENGAGLKRH